MLNYQRVSQCCDIRGPIFWYCIPRADWSLQEFTLSCCLDSLILDSTQHLGFSAILFRWLDVALQSFRLVQDSLLLDRHHTSTVVDEIMKQIFIGSMDPAFILVPSICFADQLSISYAQYIILLGVFPFSSTPIIVSQIHMSGYVWWFYLHSSLTLGSEVLFSCCASPRSDSYFKFGRTAVKTGVATLWKHGEAPNFVEVKPPNSTEFHIFWKLSPQNPQNFFMMILWILGAFFYGKSYHWRVWW